jgi:hypothetical protein
MEQNNDVDICTICGRLLGTLNIDKHHLIPRTFKGDETVTIHKICHRKLHATFTEREMLHTYHDVELIRNHEEIIKFVNWVKNKDIDFYSGSKETKTRKKKRKK